MSAPGAQAERSPAPPHPLLAPSQTAIAVRGLTVRYRSGFAALNGVDLSVFEGQSVALIGCNGAGKSTLLRCLVGLVEPTSGSVRVGGTELTTASRRGLRSVRRDVGFVFQRFHLVPRLSAFHNVVQGAMGTRGSGCAWPLTAPGSVRSDAMGALHRVGLGGFAQRRVDTLSGGQQQRVAIARMLIQKPRVILADEPVASLDPASGRAVMELLREIAREQQVTVVAALHHLDFALTYSDRIVGLRDGVVTLDRATSACDPSGLAEFFAEHDA